MRTRPLESVSNLTKREHFACQALQGLLASEFNTTRAAKLAVQLADQLIEELNKEQKPNKQDNE